jgi:polar amino acid transport system substrate-binding protein
MNFLKMAIFTLTLSPGFLQAQNLMRFTTIEKSSYATISEHVMRVAYDRLGIDMFVISLPAERAILAANMGTADGELYRIKNMQFKYKNLIMVPVPIGKLEGIAITKNKKISIKKWEELAIHRTCFRHGVKFAEAGLNNIKAQPVSLNSQLFGMLRKNRCDIIVIARITSIPLMLNFIATQKVPIYQSVLQTYPLFHYLHKKNAHLLPRLVKVLKKMQQEGLIEKIRSEFIVAMSNNNKN